MPSIEMLTRLELVHRAAVGAFGLTGKANIQIDLRVAVPDFHVGQRTGAVHAALVVKVFGQQFNQG